MAMAINGNRVALLAAALLISTSVLAEDVKREAVIVSVDGSNINAQTREGPLTVVLSPETKITETSGIAKRKGRDAKSLLPGLIFTVEGDQQGSTLTAQEITFKERDWKTAVATKAGTKEELGELRRAIIEGQEYVIQQETTVYFATGSATVSSAHKAELRALA